MYYGRLTEDELRNYNDNVLGGDWNPGAIDRDPNLTDSQKEQLKDYNRIWGD